MRILITSPVFPPDLGGPAVYVPSIGRYLVDEGHDVKVVAFCSEEQPEGYPFPVVAIPRGPLPIRYLKAFFAVLREAKGCDVVYVQEHLALLHVWAARLRGVPVVIRMMNGRATTIDDYHRLMPVLEVEMQRGPAVGFVVGP